MAPWEQLVPSFGGKVPGGFVRLMGFVPVILFHELWAKT